MWEWLCQGKVTCYSTEPLLHCTNLCSYPVLGGYWGTLQTVCVDCVGFQLDHTGNAWKFFCCCTSLSHCLVVETARYTWDVATHTNVDKIRRNMLAKVCQIQKHVRKKAVW